MVLLFNLICFALMACYPGVDHLRLLVAMAIICAAVLLTYVLIYILELGDPYPFLLVAMLSSMSIIILYSLGIQQSAQYANPSKSLIAIAENQLKWFLVGIGIFYLSYIIYRSIKFWKKLTWVYMGATVALFGVTLIFAGSLGGARNWVQIGGFGIQPSEVIKLCFVFAMSSLFCTKTRLAGFRQKLIGITREDIIVAVFVYVCLLLFLLQGELGTAVLFFMVYFTLMLVYDVPLVVPAANLALAALGVLVVFLVGDRVGAFARALDRVAIWLDPEVYNFQSELGKPYGTQQLYESLKAICS